MKATQTIQTTKTRDGRSRSKRVATKGEGQPKGSKQKPLRAAAEVREREGKSLKQLERAIVAAEDTKGKGRGGAQRMPAPPPPAEKVTPSDAGCLAYAHHVACQTAKPVAPPPILGVGEQTNPPRLYLVEDTVEFAANQDGFACFLLMPPAWTSNPDLEIAVPVNQTIGGPNVVTDGVTSRGAYACYTDDGWVPGGSANKRVPPGGTELLNPVVPDGPVPVKFPVNFINNQSSLATSDIEASNSRQTYQCTHLSASIVPDGYNVGPQPTAVNVVSGDICAFTYTSGDNQDYNVENPLAQTSGADSMQWIQELPAQDDIVKHQTVSITEWKRGTELKVFCVPDTSVALGQWPASLETTNNSGTTTSLLGHVVEGVKAGFIIRGAQATQRFKVKTRCVVAAFGTESYEANAQVQRRKPVSGEQMGDIMSRTLPLHAKPQVLPSAKGHNGGIAAFAQNKADTGTPLKAVGSVVKAAAEMAGGEGVGSIIGEVAGIVGALLL